MRKILFYLTRYPGCGGIETVTSLICGELLKRNYEIDILSHFQEGECHIEGMHIYAMPNQKKWQAIENQSYFLELVHKKQYDLLIYQDSYAPTEDLICTVGKKTKVPFIVFEHSSPLFVYNKRNLLPWYTSKGFLRRLLHFGLVFRERQRKRKLLENCKHYVLLSVYNIPEFCKIVGRPQNEKIIHIPNPITIGSREDYEKENMVLYVGRFVREKRIEKMLEMWYRLQMTAHIANWSFYLVGDGPEKMHLESYCKRMGLKNVHFEGFQNPIDYYKRAKIFLMTSSFEGWGMTLCEAMKFGVVPLALDTYSSVWEIIRNGDDGFILNDEIEMEHCVIRLIEHPTELKKMSEQAQENIKRFALENVIEKWENIINI